MAGQNQNETLLSINKGTKDDGAAMRAVALVTLTFLPATFVSVGCCDAILSTVSLLSCSRHCLACSFSVSPQPRSRNRRIGSFPEIFGYIGVSQSL